MRNLYPDFFLTNMNQSNGNHWANTGFGTAELTEITSQESLQDQAVSSNILPFRSRLVTPEQLRIFTYVLLGMTLGVITVALFLDFHVSRETFPRETVQPSDVSRETSVEKKGDSSDESDSTGAE